MLSTRDSRFKTQVGGKYKEGKSIFYTKSNNKKIARVAIPILDKIYLKTKIFMRYYVKIKRLIHQKDIKIVSMLILNNRVQSTQSKNGQN